MIGLVVDTKTAVRTFIDMRRARAEDKVARPKMVMRMPLIEARPAFYDTPEGCMFKELHDAVRGVFKGLSYKDKRTLCFSPENGRYLAKVQLWERELELALPSRQYHKAVGAILHKYVMMKLDQAAGVRTRLCQSARL